MACKQSQRHGAIGCRFSSVKRLKQEMAVLRNQYPRIAIAAFLSVFLTAEGMTLSQTNTTSPSASFDALGERATSYLTSKYPDRGFDFKLPPRVTKYQDHWEVTWELPKTVQGGAPVVELDFVTLEVRSAKFYQ
ncbi:MAG: hypothetical protein ACTHM6_01500 [Tepidisphaeraceae bacterium]